MFCEVFGSHNSLPAPLEHGPKGKPRPEKEEGNDLTSFPVYPHASNTGFTEQAQQQTRVGERLSAVAREQWAQAGLWKHLRQGTRNPRAEWWLVQGAVQICIPSRACWGDWGNT